jgi:hypothetical protein
VEADEDTDAEAGADPGAVVEKSRRRTRSAVMKKSGSAVAAAISAVKAAEQKKKKRKRKAASPPAVVTPQRGWLTDLHSSAWRLTRGQRAREEPRAQVWRPFRPSMLVVAGGFILVRGGVLRS